MNDRPIGGDSAVTIWLCAALILTLGYVVAIRPVLDQADVQTSRIEIARTDAAADESALAHGDAVRKHAAAIDRELRGTILGSTLSASTASFLAEVQRLARRDGVGLQAMRPEGAVAPPQATAAPAIAAVPGTVAPPHRASTVPVPHVDAFELETHGSFRSIVRFTSDLSTLPTLVRVTGVRLARTQTGDARIARARTLDATIAIQTLRFDRTTFH